VAPGCLASPRKPVRRIDRRVGREKSLRTAGIAPRMILALLGLNKNRIDCFNEMGYLNGSTSAVARNSL
jgi:hypothetical protein